jgi:hypothetical protein
MKFLDPTADIDQDSTRLLQSGIDHSLSSMLCHICPTSCTTCFDETWNDESLLKFYACNVTLVQIGNMDCSFT